MNEPGPTPSTKVVLTTDERFWAALAHASILLFGFGAIAALAIWITQRKKSAYIAFQSLQALLYQTVQSIVFMLVSLVIIIIDIILGVILFLNLQKTSSAFSARSIFIVFIPVIILFSLLGLYYLVALVTTGLCLAGQEAHYPWLGNWLAKYLNNDLEKIEERQDRVVASACHLGAFTSLWGAVLPLIVWLSEKGRSAVLRFQGLQALIYQLIGVVFSFLCGGAYSATYILLRLTLAVAVPASNPSNSHWALILIMIPIVALFFIMALALLLGPLYQTFALIAAWQVSHDRDYRYPLLGKWLANRLKI
jgi:uncharacterized Tic20 family protein